MIKKRMKSLYVKIKGLYNNIKSKNIFKTIGGEYSTTINNMNENIDYLIVLYEKHSYAVKTILYIKSENMNYDCVIPRNPLKSTAKRAGWQGCIIVFNHIQFVV